MASTTKIPTSDWRESAELNSTPTALNQKYQQLFDNNPYRKMTYNKTVWQDLWSALGFRTKYDKWNEQIQENAYQYDAGIYQQMYQDLYNSETAKAERMREAGENPDLLGTGTVSEASSPYQDPAGMDPSAFEDDSIGQIGSTIMGAFNTALGMASQLLQLQGMKEDIQGKGISNATSMLSLINERVLGMTPAEGFQDDESFKNWKHDVEMSLRTNYGRSFFKGSALRRWNRSIDDFIGGLPQSRDQFKAWQERLGSAKDYYYGREDHWSEAIEVFKEINQELFDLQSAITDNKKNTEYIQGQANLEEAGYNLEYQQSRDGALAGQAENAENERRKQGETFEGILNKHLTKLGERLDRLSQKGGLKGLIGEIILLILTMRGTFSMNKNGGSLSLAPPSAQ